jgi:hypothetical protein
LQFFIKEHENEFDRLMNEAEEIRKIVTTIILKLEQKIENEKA